MLAWNFEDDSRFVLYDDDNPYLSNRGYTEQLEDGNYTYYITDVFGRELVRSDRTYSSQIEAMIAVKADFPVIASI